MKAVVEIDKGVMGYYATIKIVNDELVNGLVTKSCKSKGQAKRIAIQLCAELHLDYKGI